MGASRTGSKQPLTGTATSVREPTTCYISYRRQEAELYAGELSRRLMDLGVVVLQGFDLKPGSNWAQELRSLHQRAQVLIVLLTREAAASVWLRNEVDFFLRQNRPVFPIVFGRLESIPFELRHIHAFVETLDPSASGPSQEAVRQCARFIDDVSKSDARPAVASTLPKPRNLKRATRQLNEGKLILVGRGGVGKTSLVRRLIDDEFNALEAKTEGIRIACWQLPVQDSEVTLNVWDFGGQEIMHATHQFFLTEKSIYLVVLNGREGREDTDVEYWLRHIQGFGGDSPVIVVQNKVGEHPFELNYRGLQARYPQIRAFVKTDCAGGTGIAELRAETQRAIEQTPGIRMNLPADWYAIKQKLEATDADFMGYERFRAICAEEGVTDDGDRDALAFVLHCLGIALNYRSDSRLRETSILKPEWVTEGIYKLVNAETLAHRQGELRLSDLSDLLPAKRYPPEKHSFLLELMRKFSLCFAFPDSQERYLVPDLLGKEEPEESAEFRPETCLNFEYHYEVLPEGLMPRFIVRSHTLSRGQPRWRSGVILAHEGSRALVTSLPLQRRIAIRIIGANAQSRRELLALVRYDLDRLNDEFKDSLGATAWVPFLKHPAYSVEHAKLVAFERQGVQQFPEFIDGKVLNVVVAEHLNGVDLEADRASTPATFKGVPLVFFSYTHKDETLRDELETHLKLLQRQRIIAAWHDRKILPGDEWDKEIDRHLEAARIILLLVSADFIASDYCWAKEVARAVERHNNGEAKVVPVILRTCEWEGTPFSKLQCLPEDLKPINTWADRDSAWTSVAKGIRKLAQAMVD